MSRGSNCVFFLVFILTAATGRWCDARRDADEAIAFFAGHQGILFPFATWESKACLVPFVSRYQHQVQWCALYLDEVGKLLQCARLDAWMRVRCTGGCDPVLLDDVGMVSAFLECCLWPPCGWAFNMTFDQRYCLYE